MTNDVTKKNAQAVQPVPKSAVPDFLKSKIGMGVQLKGLENTTREDYVIPRYTLMQLLSEPVTKGEATAGMFVNSALPQADPKREVKELNCYLLGLGMGRVRWSKPFKKGQAPLCRSNDGQMSADGKLKCETCEFSKWETNAQGKNECPCPKRYIWAAVDRDTLTPFTITAAGASVKETKKILSWFKVNGFPPFVVKMRIGSRRISDEKGTYYVMEYVPETNPDGSVAFVDSEELCNELERTTTTMMNMMADTIVAHDIDTDASGGIDDVASGSEGNGNQPSF